MQFVASYPIEIEKDFLTVLFDFEEVPDIDIKFHVGDNGTKYCFFICLDEETLNNTIERIKTLKGVKFENYRTIEL